MSAASFRPVSAMKLTVARNRFEAGLKAWKSRTPQLIIFSSVSSQWHEGMMYSYMRELVGRYVQR